MAVSSRRAAWYNRGMANHTTALCDHTFRALALVALLAALAGCDSASQNAASETITVMAAASTTGVVEDVAALFERANTGIEVVVNAGPSNGLAQQIIAGAPADVFLSANETWADAVAEEGLSAEAVGLLTNRIVLVVPKGNPAGVINIAVPPAANHCVFRGDTYIRDERINAARIE